VWDAITAAAATESPLWAEATLGEGAQDREPVFSSLAPELHALGLETIYEGYLVHYGRSRLFAPADRDMALLLGDYLYAHGLVHVAKTGDVEAVSDLAELISLCSQARADGRDDEAIVGLEDVEVLDVVAEVVMVLADAQAERLGDEPERRAVLPAERHPAGRQCFGCGGDSDLRRLGSAPGPFRCDGIAGSVSHRAARSPRAADCAL